MCTPWVTASCVPLSWFALSWIGFSILYMDAFRCAPAPASVPSPPASTRQSEYVCALCVSRSGAADAAVARLDQTRKRLKKMTQARWLRWLGVLMLLLVRATSCHADTSDRIRARSQEELPLGILQLIHATRNMHQMTALEQCSLIQSWGLVYAKLSVIPEFRLMKEKIDRQADKVLALESMAGVANVAQTTGQVLTGVQEAYAGAQQI